MGTKIAILSMIRMQTDSPISIEVVWATKQWPNHVFAFLFAITEFNCFLLESHFTNRKHDSMMDFIEECNFNSQRYQVIQCFA